MAEAAVERSLRRYYCHQCSTEITPVIPEYTCPTCNSGFIEEVNSSGTDSNTRDTSSQNLPPDPAMQFAQMFTLLGAPFAQPPMQRQFSGQQQDAAHQGNGSVDVQGADARAGPSGPGPRGTNIRVVRAAGRNPYMEGLLNYFLSRLGGDVNMHGLPAVNMFQLHGNPADYAWGAGGLDAIITQLLNQLESSGPPPADRDKITALPTVAISQEQVDRTLQCSVCMEYFTLEEDVKKLPCDHHYHEPCIVPWLEMHGTCPVCRKDLNGHDTTTEVPPVPDLAAAAAQNGAPSSRSSTSNTSSDTNPSLD